MNNLLIREVVLNDRTVDILIKEGIIYSISSFTKGNNSDIDCKVIEGRGMRVLPGFINMHTHSAMTLMRGVGEDLKLKSWLDLIWQIEPKLDDELIYWGTKLACLEMIKTGTTAFLDQYWNIESANAAIAEMGLRSMQTYVALNLDESKNDNIEQECYAAFEKSKKWANINKFGISVHAPYSVNGELIKWCSNFAKENGLKLHIHVSETKTENENCIKEHGLSPFKYLNSLGVLDSNLIAAHCVHLDEEDINLIAKNNVKVVHNINSNLKLSSGYKFLYNELKGAGILVSLGTDGCGSSNNLDIRETMKTTALLQKGWREDPTALPLNELLDMATINGAKSLGFNCGEVAVGREADLILIDTDNYQFTPNINFLSNFIYSANSSCINSVICNGKVLMQDRCVKGEREIIENVNRIFKRLY